MATEIEKQFFETFGIEPKSVKRTLKLAMPGYDESDIPEDLRQFISSQAQVYYVYSQITDRILLELICILNPYCYPSGENIQHLKEGILEWCIKYKEDIKQQVKSLFKEG